MAHVDAIYSLRRAGNYRHETLLVQALTALSVQRLRVIKKLATMARNAERDNAYADYQYMRGLEGYKNV